MAGGAFAVGFVGGLEGESTAAIGLGDDIAATVVVCEGRIAAVQAVENPTDAVTVITTTDELDGGKRGGGIVFLDAGATGEDEFGECSAGRTFVPLGAAGAIIVDVAEGPRLEVRAGSGFYDVDEAVLVIVAVGFCGEGGRIPRALGCAAAIAVEVVKIGGLGFTNVPD